MKGLVNPSLEPVLVMRPAYCVPPVKRVKTTEPGFPNFVHIYFLVVLCHLNKGACVYGTG